MRPSFVPPKPIRELRDLTRYRKALIQERTREVQRLDKTLQDAGIKLSSVASDVLGRSGRAMLDALVGGTHDPAVLADLARGRLRAKLPQLREALEGRFRAHHALILGELLGHIDYLDEAVARLSEEVHKRVAPFAEEVALLDTIVGVDKRAAEVILAEIGADMSRFPTDRHLASWAGVCPGNNESAGKRFSGRTRKGSKWLRTTLTECAESAARSKGTYLASQYARLKGRRGHKKAIGAVVHSILVIAYQALQRRRAYQDLGPNYLLLRDNTESYTKRLVRQLERLGNKVTLEPLAQTARRARGRAPPPRILSSERPPARPSPLSEPGSSAVGPATTVGDERRMSFAMGGSADVIFAVDRPAARVHPHLRATGEDDAHPRDTSLSTCTTPSLPSAHPSR